MRILVIGGTGFIASQIVCELEKYGHEIILGVRKNPPKIICVNISA
jgi:nucleoside-diphosphate-sugar epimerase